MAGKPFPTKEIWQRLDSAQAWNGDWFAFTSEDQIAFNEELQRKASVSIRVEQLAESFEGRPLHLLRLGSGKRRVLIWARQHGNEPECTAALCTALHEIATSPDHPVYKTILDHCELLVLPMVNPDGNDYFIRQCATGIDLNREAQALSMTEAQQLVRLKDEYKPEFSFNLHDMVPRKSREGEDAGLISIAFQAGPIDENNSDNDARLRAKTIIGKMFRTVEQVTPKESICRYKAYYMNRGFGDSMNRWGVPCVLIESGSWYTKEGGDEYVIRLHALALLAGLYAFALRQDEPFDGDLYEEIPFEVATYEFDGLYRETQILDSKTAKTFRADLGWQKHLFDDRVAPHRQYQSRIQQAGDISEENGVDQRRLPGRLIVPGVIALAPHLVPENQEITQQIAHSLVRAGITTAAIAAGPFADAKEADEYIENCYRGRPPMNLVVFERVNALEEVIQRNAMTAFAGFFVGNLKIGPQQLLELLHRFVPEIKPALRDVHENVMLGLELFYVSAGSPNDTRIILSLHALQDTDSEAAFDFEPSLLENLIGTFLRSPHQLHFAWTGDDWMPDFLPAETAPVGIPMNHVLAPNFVAHRLHHLPEPASGSAARLLASMTDGMADALRLISVGAVRYGHRADFFVVPQDILTSRNAPNIAPEIVVLNGEVAHDDQDRATPAFHGIWTFAH